MSKQEYNVRDHFKRIQSGAGNTIFKTSQEGVFAGGATYTDAKWKVDYDGVMTADSAVLTSATITGTITATAGKIGSATNYWNIGSGTLTAVSGSADVYINYGKTLWDNTQTGFILGYDYSDSLPKFYIGTSTNYFNFDGSDFTVQGGTLTGGVFQTATSGFRTKINGSQNRIEFLEDSTILCSIENFTTGVKGMIINTGSATNEIKLQIDSQDCIIAKKDGNDYCAQFFNLGRIFATSGDSANLYVNLNWTPDQDNTRTCGTSGNQWSDVRTVLINGAAYIEQGLLTEEQKKEERDYGKLKEFDRGDVMVWKKDRLVKSYKYRDTNPKAVASKNGTPIVLGAEPIRVQGKVKVGDKLVTAPNGKAVARKDASWEECIAQSLENTKDGGIIKALIK